MAYLLKFPPSTRPQNLLSEPFVVFGIQGINIFTSLPSRIPMAMVLHYAPKLRTWVLPPPENLPKKVAADALRTPLVGINILEPIAIDGLLWIINKMLQVSGAPLTDPLFFNVQPDICASVRILQAWKTLEIAPAGADGLRIHLTACVMMGPPVTLEELKTVWESFEKDSAIAKETAQNFYRNTIEMEYTHLQAKAFREYITADRERRKFFKSLESEFPNSEGVFEPIKSNESKPGEEDIGSIPYWMEPKQSAVSRQRSAEILENFGTRRVSVSEKRAREKNDGEEMRRRLRRLRSDESLRSVEDEPLKPIADYAGDEEKQITVNESDMVDMRADRRRSEVGEANILTRFLRPFTLNQKQDKQVEKMPPERSFPPGTDPELLFQATHGSLLAQALERYAKEDYDGQVANQEMTTRHDDPAKEKKTGD
ncbi:hypothetical protein CC78DRAFT_542806 [Lojkania enalia]|uniref:Uncharacterized protein n=1 Tax=Lojkania enalia TaxID=147567 RepID=A0A9P4N8R0_9PLEO|nr:hypothetical protein CC78DRAFT_542806 [Didymosphaeria enalia]